MRRFTVLGVVVSILVTSAVSSAKTPDERIAEIERQLDALQKTYLANNQDTASAVARISEFQDEFNFVKGQAEAVSHQLKVQQEELMRLIGDLDARIQTIEDRMGVYTGQSKTSVGKTSPEAAGEAESYQRAFDLANMARYLEAASEFESFLRKYPKSTYVANARRWVAECFYSLRDYKRAIKEFQNFIERHPRDSKVPEAILKQGNSFYELGMLDEAKAFYQKVVSSYSSSPEAAKAKTKLQRIEERKAGAKKEGGTAPISPQGGLGGATGDVAPGGTGSYPAETIEQQRQRMSGGLPQKGPAKDEVKEKQKPGIPPREF